MSSLRYRLSRCMIHAGLMVMPEGRYKTELLEVLWTLHDKVSRTIRVELNEFSEENLRRGFVDGGDASAS